MRRSWGMIRRTFSASFQAGSTTETSSLPTSGAIRAFSSSRAVVTLDRHGDGCVDELLEPELEHEEREEHVLLAATRIVLAHEGLDGSGLEEPAPLGTRIEEDLAEESREAA